MTYHISKTIFSPMTSNDPDVEIWGWEQNIPTLEEALNIIRQDTTNKNTLVPYTTRHKETSPNWHGTYTDPFVGNYTIWSN